MVFDFILNKKFTNCSKTLLTLFIYSFIMLIVKIDMGVLCNFAGQGKQHIVSILVL